MKYNYTTYNKPNFSNEPTTISFTHFYEQYARGFVLIGKFVLCFIFFFNFLQAVDMLTKPIVYERIRREWVKW